MNQWETLNTKQLTDLTISELALVHLSQGHTTFLRGGSLETVLTVVYQEINHIKHQTYAKNFIPIVSAFAVLDQLGFCYGNVKLSTWDANPIKQALYYFCGFPKGNNDIRALYALRNSFVHNASAVSICKYGNPNNNFRFIYDRELPQLIKHSNLQWDGNFSSFNGTDHSTIINPDKLIDLVTTAREKALELLNKNELSFNFPDNFEGRQEFYYRFLRFNPSDK